LVSWSIHCKFTAILNLFQQLLEPAGRNFIDIEYPSCCGFADLWDPFFPDRNLREMMNTMKRVFRDPVDYSAPVDQQRTPWDVIEDGEGFKLRVDMPGLSKEEVRRFPSVNFFH
jgi:hypothetical protein